jgi:hypothetical protein
VAHPDNTDTIWVGSDETAAPDVSSSSGYPLQPGGSAIILQANNLNELWFDADASGAKACWLRLA